MPVHNSITAGQIALGIAGGFLLIMAIPVVLGIAVGTIVTIGNTIGGTQESIDEM